MEFGGAGETFALHLPRPPFSRWELISPPPFSSEFRAWRLTLTAGILIVCWILPGVISAMHESDQATVLSDAWHLSKGGSWQPGVFYNYDKLFVTDWLLAADFWAMRQAGGPR